MKKNAKFLPIGLLISLFMACQFNSENSPQGIMFDEPDAPQPVYPVQDWDKLKPGVQLAWGSSNVRYHREYIPKIEPIENLICTGWKNERVYAQLVAWSKDTVKNLEIQVSDLKSGNAHIDSKAVKQYFIRNVISDEFLGGCGYKTKKQETAHLVPDCLEEAEAYTMKGKSTRGIWFNINIPEEAEAGSYTANVTIKVQGKKVKTLNLTLNVLNQKLPDPEDWKYHLDLWQNPYAVARVHNVRLWSNEHFEIMKPLYKMLADAGQKCITASIVDKPWGGQAYDPYESMIKRTLKANGEWEFNYEVLDNWIAFMMELGIDKQINCYSLIPWGNHLSYFDEKLGRDTFRIAVTTSIEYAEYWIPFLKDFSSHMKQKELFDITAISMDERPLRDMQKAIDLIKEYSGFKITSAANYNPGISDKVFDLSVESKHILPKQALEKRRKNGQKTTFYVCCSAEYPNNFTYSPPAEGVWQGWYAYSKNLDGFLRWAYNSWVEDPMHDTRFRTWPAGDAFLVYPGAKSSIRFEKLREGIQDYEKLQFMIDSLKKSGKAGAEQQLKNIENLLDGFKIELIKKDGALKMVLQGKELLNASSQF